MRHIKWLLLSLFLVVIFSNFAHADYNSPTAIWGFENNLLDSSGNGYTLTAKYGNAFNATNYKVGSFSRSGNGSLYNGDNITNIAFNFTTNNFTIAFWVNAQAADTPNLFGQSYTDSESYDGFQIRGVTDTLIFRDPPASFNMITNKTVFDGTWHYVVLVREGLLTRQCKIYVDSRLSNISKCSQQFNNTNFIVGGGAGNIAKFLGSLDNVRVYNGYAFNQTDVNYDYNGGIGRGSGQSLTYPTDGSTVSSLVVNFSAIATSSANLANATLYVWYPNSTLLISNTTNITGVSNVTNWTVGGFTLGTFYWNVLSCDVVPSCRYSATNSSFTVGFDQNNFTYNATTISSSTESFVLNITLPSSVSLTSAYFHYNNSIYAVTPTFSDGNTFLTKTLTIPSVATKTNNTFFYELNLFDGSITLNYNTTALNQTVSPLSSVVVGSSACAAGYNLSYAFSFADELTKYPLTSNVSYNIKYGVSLSDTLTASGNLTSVTTLYFCTNATTQTYQIASGEVKYGGSTYVTRSYYLFSGSRFTAIATNTTLYSLLDASATTFLFTVSDTQYEPEVGFYIGLLRWYPEDNAYRIVEMGMTDNKGQAPLRVQIDDTDYRIGVYYPNGTLVKLFDPIRFVCTTTPCSYSVFVPIEPTEFINLQNLQQSLTFNATSKVFTYIWNDVSQQTTLMNLTVYKDASTGTTVLCSSSTSGYSGMLVCDVSAYTGTLRAMVYRTASPTIIVASFIATIGQALSDFAEGKTIGLFFSFILFAFTFLAGMFNPVIAIIMGVVALTVSLYIGTITITVFMGIILLGFLVIHFMRRS